ncbi:MAG: hypothetical protein JXN63_02150, partial [Candidatus Delongbacteria bacterium]|nr:hypothetical protein [Candidatus Delongbacteria bacterium]
MELDLKTMWFILLVIFNIQVFIFAYQYFANKEYKFALYWLYWSLCGSLSMLLVLSRSYEPLIKAII